MENEEEKLRRESARTLRIPINQGDKARILTKWAGSLHAISENRIIRIRPASQIDPGTGTLGLPDEQIPIFDVGCRSPIVARTVVQTEQISKLKLLEGDKHDKVMDATFEVMSSLITLKWLHQQLSENIKEAKDRIESALFQQAPRTVVTISSAKNLHVIIRSIILEGKRALNASSSLINELFDLGIPLGHFHKAKVLIEEKFGTDSPASSFLKHSEIWIKWQIDLRNAVEHPKADQRINIVNFQLNASGEVECPHLSIRIRDKVEKIDALNFSDRLIEEMLIFFEELVISSFLSLENQPPFQYSISSIAKEDIDPSCPVLFRASLSLPNRTPK